MSRRRLYIRTHGPTKTGVRSTACPEICDPSTTERPTRCITCQPQRSAPTCLSEGHNRHLFKQMFKTVRVAASEYTMNKGALEVGNESTRRLPENNNQASDRVYASGSIARLAPRMNVPTRGNSLKTTKTSLRPGALAPGGIGVDVKHNSYDRYLARIKGRKPLKEGPTCEIVDSKAIMNNKPRKYNIVSVSPNCNC